MFEKKKGEIAVYDDREKESSNNYFVPLGNIFAEMCKQHAIKEGAVLVVLADKKDE